MTDPPAQTPDATAHLPAAPSEPPRRRSWGRYIAAALVALAVAVAGGIMLRGRPPRVEVLEPRLELVAQTLTASGSVRGAREVELSVERGGVLVDVLVSEGEAVAPGQVVAVLADDVEIAQSEQAQAAVDTARARLQEVRAGANATAAAPGRPHVCRRK